MRIIDARITASLIVVIAAQRQIPISKEECVLGADVGGDVRRIGQLIAAEIRLKTTPPVRRILEWIVGDAEQTPEGNAGGVVGIKRPRAKRTAAQRLKRERLRNLWKRRT